MSTTISAKAGRHSPWPLRLGGLSFLLLGPHHPLLGGDVGVYLGDERARLAELVLDEPDVVGLSGNGGAPIAGERAST